MAENDPGSGQPLDVEKIHYLVRLMKRYDLTDLNIRDGQVQIRLRRGGPDLPHASPHSQQPAPAAGPAYSSPAREHAAPPPSRPEAAADTQTAVIKSPMVGTYYSSSAPDAPPFVTVGSVVHSESTVCIIEAMKVFTDIPAGVAGTIAEVLVKNGQPVEFDQPLFRVIPA
ncbi:MAG: acetyl-CoA carboxylase biotin carboxyl carrier protein [Isosphaeraceae bacterium]